MFDGFTYDDTPQRPSLADFDVEEPNGPEIPAVGKTPEAKIDQVDQEDLSRFVKVIQDALVEQGHSEQLELSNDPAVIARQRQFVGAFASSLLADNFPVLRYTRPVLEQVIGAVVDYICGYGPIQPLLEDKEITELIARWTDPVLVERHGVLEESDTAFTSVDQMRVVMQRIAREVSAELTEAEPVVNAWLKDGSRVNMVIPPISPNGPVLTIRKFSDRFFTLDDLVGFGSLPKAAAGWLRRCVEEKVNIVVSGGTGTGKTAMVRALCFAVPEDEYMVTIEDVWELRLERSRRRVTSMVRRGAGSDGTGEVSLRDLLKNSLRMRPERIVVGEVRGEEALEMIQALSTGHDGGLSTVHANSSAVAVRSRIPMAATYSGEITFAMARMQTNMAIELIVQIGRERDGFRHVVEIAAVEADDANPEIATIQPVWQWRAGALRQVAEPIGNVKSKLGGG